MILADEKKLFELVKRSGFTLNTSGRQEIEEAIRKKRGGVWLELTPEQTQSCGTNEGRPTGTNATPGALRY